MLYERIKTEHRRLEEQVLALETEIARLPPGKLLCTRCRGSYKWYQSDGRKKRYIRKKERRLAEALAVKKYLSHLLEDAKSEKRALEFYLRHHREDVKGAEHLLQNDNGLHELLAPYFVPREQELKEWMNAEYERNELYPENRKHKTAYGLLVRSKSEAIIGLVLAQRKVPFRYECALRLGDVTLYPDFTIRHPRTGEMYYWEHFGLMDDVKYRKKTASKLEHYLAHGMIPSINLITTYETQAMPLDYAMVEKMVEDYFG